MSRLFQFALFFFSAIPLTSQIFDLAVTDDGGQLYFSTPFRQRGTDQYTHTKLFRIAENGLELVAQTERRMEGANTSNYYAPVEASVSGAGTLLAYTLRRDCIGGSGCVFVERNRGRARSGGFSADIDQVRALVQQGACMRYSCRGVRMASAVGKRVRRHVHDAHHERPLEWKRIGAAMKCTRHAGHRLTCSASQRRTNRPALPSRAAFRLPAPAS